VECEINKEILTRTIYHTKGCTQSAKRQVFLNEKLFHGAVHFGDEQIKRRIRRQNEGELMVL
jgi:hypothetical protein